MEGPEDELDELAAKIDFEQLPEPVEWKKTTFDEVRKTLIDAANQVFGWLSWNHAVVSQNVDYVDCNEGVYSVGVSSVIRVELKDGTYHQDVGYGTSEGLRSKMQCISQAREDSVFRGMRSALLSFGGKISEILLNSDFCPVGAKNHDRIQQIEVNTPEKKPLVQLFPTNHESTTPSTSGKTAKKSNTTHTSPVLNSLQKNPTSDEDSRLERKRRQQQKQEQFRQQFKQQKLLQNLSDKNTPHKMLNSIPNKVNTCEWPVTTETPLAEEEFLSTQEVEQMVQTKTAPLLAVSAEIRSPKDFSARPDGFIPKKTQLNLKRSI